MIDDYRARHISDIELARERSLRHACHADDRRHTALLQCPEIGAIVDLMRWNGMPVPVAGQEHYFALRNLSEQQRRRRLSKRGSHDFAVGDGKRGQAGKPAAADDGEHEWWL